MDFRLSELTPSIVKMKTYRIIDKSSIVYVPLSLFIVTQSMFKNYDKIPLRKLI